MIERVREIKFDEFNKLLDLYKHPMVHEMETERRWQVLRLTHRSVSE